MLSRPRFRAATLAAFCAGVAIALLLIARDMPARSAAAEYRRDNPPPAPLLLPAPTTPATLIRAIDGDTAVMRLTLYAAGKDERLEWTTHVRIDGVNAPDHGPGKAAAKAKLEEIARTHTLTAGPVTARSLDRVVCRIYRAADEPGGQPVDIGDDMRAAGFDVPWGQ